LTGTPTTRGPVRDTMWAMSETPDSRQNDDAPGPNQSEPGSAGTPPAAPYPGWSTAQPPQTGWQSPSSGAPSGWSAPPDSSGGDQQPGWGNASTWGWAQSVKPGVIPLRPLGVGEILDGAVTTIRRNPGPMLGLSAVVAVILQLAGLAVSWMIFQWMGDFVRLAEEPTTEEIMSLLGGTMIGVGIILVVDWVGTVILTGMLTVVVSRAVLGEKMNVSEAWRRARPRLLKLLGLTIVYSLLWLGPFLVALAISLAIVLSGAPEATIAVAVLFWIAAAPATIWLYVRYALAVPALMLETTSSRYDNRGVRPIGVVMALRRSAELVRRSWWRVFGILLLIALISWLITQVLSVAFFWIPTGFVEASGQFGFGSIVVATIGGILTTTITAPFVAGSIALLYVDRRIRAEALDIELARAAGVTIPGRPAQ
jgi:hypothetical protein